MEMDREEVWKILAKHHFEKSSLIAVLQDIQAKMNYLPREALLQVSKGLDTPLPRIYEVATFYRAFRLEPRGKHTVQVCLGTACHVRGGERILDYLESRFGVKAGETTPDLAFTLETVNCLGACALGPILVVDGQYFGHIHPSRVESVIRKFL